MFTNRTVLLADNPAQRNYGVAVADIDQDGRYEFFVAGFGHANLMLQWNGSQYVDVAPPALADPTRLAIGVGAGDIDGDGLEEVYILNTDTFAGEKQVADRLFDLTDEGWVDLFSLPINQNTLNLTAGRSVVFVDRTGDGRYAIFLANYGGPMRLYELDDDGYLHDVAPSAKVDLTTGGRGLVSFPMVSDSMDIFAGNERGPNFLFQNKGDGTFDEVAHAVGLDDPYENVRGIAVVDANGDGRLDLVYGNWEGAHRFFVQSTDGYWDDIAPPAMAAPSRIRTVIAADFDNDGHQEIFFNNIGEPNRLFARRDSDWVAIDMGDAREPDGLGTGAAIADLDGDGRLELLIAHGESGLQPLSLYHTPQNDNHYLRVVPLTLYGAPARGAIVTLLCEGRTQRRVIDSGSGYLCQMEPIAHFGLGQATVVERVDIRWPDGTQQRITSPDADSVLRVPFPKTGDTT